MDQSEEKEEVAPETVSSENSDSSEEVKEREHAVPSKTQINEELGAGSSVKETNNEENASESDGVDGDSSVKTEEEEDKSEDFEPEEYDIDEESDIDSEEHAKSVQEGSDEDVDEKEKQAFQNALLESLMQSEDPDVLLHVLEDEYQDSDSESGEEEMMAEEVERDRSDFDGRPSAASTNSLLRHQTSRFLPEMMINDDVMEISPDVVDRSRVSSPSTTLESSKSPSDHIVAGDAFLTDSILLEPQEVVYEMIGDGDGGDGGGDEEGDDSENLHEVSTTTDEQHQSTASHQTHHVKFTTTTTTTTATITKGPKKGAGRGKTTVPLSGGVSPITRSLVSGTDLTTASSVLSILEDDELRALEPSLNARLDAYFREMPLRWRKSLFAKTSRLFRIREKVAPQIIDENKKIVKKQRYSLLRHGRSKSVVSEVDLHEHIANMRRNCVVYGGYDDHGAYQSVLFQVETMNKKKKRFRETTIRILNDECLSVGFNLERETGERPLILSLSKRVMRNVCGAWDSSFRGTQEEWIERHSAVYRLALDPKLNPLLKERLMALHDASLPRHHIPEFGVVYIEGVPIIRAQNYSLMPHALFVDIVACGGVDLRPTIPVLMQTDRARYSREGSSRFSHMFGKGTHEEGFGSWVDTDTFDDATRKKIRMILSCGILTEHKSLVLGALGCGAFKNPASRVAKLFEEVLKEPLFKNRFQYVYFAVLGYENSEKFRQVFLKPGD